MVRPFVRPLQGTEREMLQANLDFLRDALVAKVEGITRVQAVSSLVPSMTTLLGLLKHSTDTQECWFRQRMKGEDIPLTYYRPDDEDADWRIDQHDTVESVVAAFRDACGRADRSVAGCSLDDVAPGTGGGRTLRWIFLLMIEESARHCGHADIIRELTDGATGE